MTLLGTPITLRQGARVIEDSRRLRVVTSARLSAFGGKADIGRCTVPIISAAIDPNVWSGRALQENFDRDGGCAVLHQCIRPLIGALRAPGHHGYQRA